MNFHLRFHLPGFTCSPWGLSINVNRLAQITSSTHQSDPTVSFLSSCSLSSVPHPVTILSDYHSNAVRPQQVYWWNFIQQGKEWGHFQNRIGKKKRKKNKTHLIASRPRVLMSSLHSLCCHWEEKWGCGRWVVFLPQVGSSSVQDNDTLLV